MPGITYEIQRAGIGSGADLVLTEPQALQSKSSTYRWLGSNSSLGLVVGDPEAEQGQRHLDRLLAGVLDRDLEVDAGPHGGQELVVRREGRQAAGIVAG